MKILVTISVLALLLACGGSDSGQDSAGSAETPPVAAANGGGAPTPEAPSAPAAAEPSTDPQVQSCLDLVRDGQYQQAVPVCLAALKIDPNNQQVKSALARAQTQTASAADAQDAATAAAGAAADSAQGDASAKLGEATGGMKLGE